MDFDPRMGLIPSVGLDIEVPPEFPQKYHDALIRAASQCAVKKHLETPPQFEVRTVVASKILSPQPSGLPWMRVGTVVNRLPAS